MMSIDMRVKKARRMDTKRWLRRVSQQRRVLNAKSNSLEEYLKLYSLQKEVSNVIEQLSDERLRKIAKQRYIDCLSWNYIEKDNAYCHSHMIRLNGEILSCVAKIIYGNGDV